jgi:hypothetical protein
MRVYIYIYIYILYGNTIRAISERHAMMYCGLRRNIELRMGYTCSHLNN